MKQQATLHTARLTLRPFTLADAPAIQRLAGTYEVALNTLLIPHPYPDGAAEQWISKHAQEFEENRIHHFALDAEGELLGAMALVMKDPGMAEIGYWIGVPYWGRGYTSEAAAEVLRYGFESADCSASSPATSRATPHPDACCRKSACGTKERCAGTW